MDWLVDGVDIRTNGLKIMLLHLYLGLSLLHLSPDGMIPSPLGDAEFDENEG